MFVFTWIIFSRVFIVLNCNISQHQIGSLWSKWSEITTDWTKIGMSKITWLPSASVDLQLGTLNPALWPPRQRASVGESLSFVLSSVGASLSFGLSSVGESLSFVLSSPWTVPAGGDASSCVQQLRSEAVLRVGWPPWVDASANWPWLWNCCSTIRCCKLWDFRSAVCLFVRRWYACVND